MSLCVTSRLTNDRLCVLKPCSNGRQRNVLLECVARQSGHHCHHRHGLRTAVAAVEVLPELSHENSIPTLQTAADAVEIQEFEDTEDIGSIPSTLQVQNFLSLLCEETEIAEVELKVGNFEMKVKRSVKGVKVPVGGPGVMALAHAPGHAIAPPAPAVAAPAPVPEPVASVPMPAFEEEDDEVEEEENFMLIASPKVGVLQRSRLVKGVFGRKLVKEGDNIKKGQVLCFIKQMGNQVPVKSPQAGELVKFLVEDGDNVEYRQDIVELVPFFGGHIIGDSKLA